MPGLARIFLKRFGKWLRQTGPSVGLCEIWELKLR